MAYSRVLRRRTRSPYLDIIQAQGPAARSAKYLEEERALADEGMELQRESLEQQGVEARDRLALTREGMELGASQAEKAQQIQMAQTGLMGAYAGHKVYKGLAGPGTTAPTIAPTGPNLPVTTERGMVAMGPGTTGTSTVAPAPATVFTPTETGEIPLRVGEHGQEVLMGPGYTAPGTAATVTPGGVGAVTGPAPSMAGAQATGVAPGGAGTLETIGETGGGGGSQAGGMTVGTKVGYGVAGAQQAYGLYRGLDRSSSTYEEGSKGKYGSALGRVGGSAVGAYFGGPLGMSVGGEVGAYLGEKTFPGIVRGFEAGDEIVEDLARLKIHSAGERTGDAIAGMGGDLPVTKTIARGVGDVIEESSRVLDDIIPSCIIYTYFYGPHSREKRYARIFCARHMTKERYLGYIAAGTKIIDLAKKYPLRKNKLKSIMPEPYFRYMMYKLKGGKLSIRDRIAAATLNKWFDWEAARLGDNIVINDNLRSCYHNAGGRMS